MKEVCALAVVFLMAAYPARYIWRMVTGKVDTAISGWIIFQSATWISLATYVVAEDADLLTGILNTMDVVAEASILITAFVVAKSKKLPTLKSFEKAYLAVAAAILCYALLTGDAWGANVAIQALVVLGYGPILHNILTAEDSGAAEDRVAWQFGFAAATVGTFPAVVDGNWLAVIYAVREVVCIGILLFAIHWRKTARS